jgi:putative transposase
MELGLRLRYSKWERKYHLVLIPKCRRKMFCGQLRQDLGEAFRALAKHKESQIEA